MGEERGGKVRQNIAQDRTELRSTGQHSTAQHSTVRDRTAVLDSAEQGTVLWGRNSFYPSH